MALTNLPYDDDAIVAAVRDVAVRRQEVRDVRVDFSSTDVDESTEATVTATFAWTVSAADAARILADAAPVGTTATTD